MRDFVLFCYLIYFYVYECFDCMYVYHVRAWRPQKPEVTGPQELELDTVENTIWELSSGPLEEQKELLAPEPSLHPLYEVLLLHHRCCSTYVNKSHVKREVMVSLAVCSKVQEQSIPAYTTLVRNSAWLFLICTMRQVQ